MSQRVMKALQHVRHALIANKEGAPIQPALLCAEEELLRELFSEQEVEDYLRVGSPVLGRPPEFKTSCVRDGAKEPCLHCDECRYWVPGSCRDR